MYFLAYFLYYFVTVGGFFACLYQAGELQDPILRCQNRPAAESRPKEKLTRRETV